MIANFQEASDNFTHAYFLSDEDSDAIRLGILFNAQGDQLVCKTFNERTHSSMPEALSALVAEAKTTGVEEVRVTCLRETGAFRITLADTEC